MAIDGISATAKLAIYAGVVMVGVTMVLLIFTAQSGGSSKPSYSTTTIGSTHSTTSVAATTTVLKNYTVFMSLREYSINPKSVTVYRGTRISMHVFNAGSKVHDFIIEGIPSADISSIQPMQNATINFTATLPGTYLIYDNIGNDTTMGMVANLIVN